MTQRVSRMFGLLSALTGVTISQLFLLFSSLETNE